MRVAVVVCVHLAARVLELTLPGEIWATSVVRGLVAGSPIRFSPRARHELRGIPDTWELYAVADG